MMVSFGSTSRSSSMSSCGVSSMLRSATSRLRVSRSVLGISGLGWFIVI